MLDLLRKQAQSTKVRVLFAGIILTFVLFFGYSSFDEQFQTAGVVANVDDHDISEGLFKLFYEQNLSRLKGSVKGDAELPDFMAQFARTNTLRELVRRTVALEQAERLGLKISDEFLARQIVDLQRKEGEDFDPIAYQTTFLPYFSKTYNLNLEEVMRQDIALQQLARLFETSGPPLEPSDGIEPLQWTFEAVSLEAKEGEEREATAKGFIENPSRWKELAKRHGVEPRTYGPLTIATRHEVEPIAGTFDAMLKLFALSPETPVLQTPLSQGERLIVVRLVARETPKDTTAAAGASSLPYLDAWISHAQSQAKVASFLDETPAPQ